MDELNEEETKLAGVYAIVLHNFMNRLHDLYNIDFNELYALYNIESDKIEKRLDKENNELLRLMIDKSK